MNNNNYSSLRILANILTAFGWIQIAASIFAFFIVGGGMQSTYRGDFAVGGFVMILGICLFSAFTSIIWFAAAQFIKLMVNIAIHTENTDNNVYVIASKIEEHFNQLKQ